MMWRWRDKAGTVSGGRRQRGFSLWELTILLGFLALLLAAGMAMLKAGDGYRGERARLAQLQAAERALEGFVAERGRLPCPDTQGDGSENCAAGVQKGWLPVATLGFAAGAGQRGPARLRYLVYRSSEVDLAALVDRYNPVQYDLSTTYSFNQFNTLDFCAGLSRAAAAGNSTALAHIPAAGGAAQNVAYALAEPGSDRDSDGDIFDGQNVSAQPRLDSPARPADDNYDDRVRARSFAELMGTLRCQQATRSIDAISQAVEVGLTVADLQQANKDNGTQQIVNAAISTAMNVAVLALGVATEVTGALVLAAAISELSAAIASCVVLVGCAFIPTATAAVATATAGLAVGAAGIVIYAVAIPLNAVALAQSVTATNKAGASAPSGMPANTLSPAEQLANMKTALDAATADLQVKQAAAAQAKGDYEQKIAQLTALLDEKQLDGTARYTDAQKQLVWAALTAYYQFAQAEQAYQSAQATATTLRKQADQATPAAAQAAAIKAREEANKDPTNLAKQRAAEAAEAALTGEGAKALADKYAKLDAAATQAEQQVAALKATRDAAEASYQSARLQAESAVPAVGSPLGLFDGPLDLVIKAYVIWQDKERIAQQAAQKVKDQQAAYDAMVYALNQGATSGGGAAGVFSGGEAILRAAEGKGVLQ